MKLIELTIEEWDKLADDPDEYCKIRVALSDGHEVALKDECGVVYAYLKIDEIDKIKYVYKGFVD